MAVPTDINDVRIKKLEELLSGKLTRAQMGRDLGFQDGAMIYQYVSGRRPISEAVARKIEKKYGKHKGWMDDEPAVQEKTALTGEQPAHYDVTQLVGPKGNQRRVGADRAVLVIPILETKASMGHGASLPAHDAVIDNLRLTKDWVHQNLRAMSNPSNLAVLSAYGDSMEPTLSDGDLCLVDRGVNEVKIDAVYVLQLKDELFIKRLQRRNDGTILMISDNKNYPPYEIKVGNNFEHFKVLGRVLWAWNGRKL